MTTIANVTLALGTPLDISLTQGATYTMQIEAVGEDNVTPWPLDGYRAHMQIRRKAGSGGVPLVDLTSEGDSADILIQPVDEDNNPQPGMLQIRIPATETEMLKRSVVYDLFLIDSNDSAEAIRLVYGQVAVSPSVTVN